MADRSELGKAYGLKARSTRDLRQLHVDSCGHETASRTKPAVVRATLRCLRPYPLVVSTCQLPRIDRRTYNRLLEILQNLDWRLYEVPSKRTTSGRSLEEGQGSLLMGTSHGVPNSSGFDSRGHNHKLCPNKVAPADATALRSLWRELRALTKKADRVFRFSSVQINKNFTGHPHRDKNDTTFQFALSLGNFKGGELVVATDDPLLLVKYNTNGRLTKCDGRHPHWVTPHTSGDRYSLIMYSITAKETARLSNRPQQSSMCKTGKFRASSEPRRQYAPHAGAPE